MDPYLLGDCSSPAWHQCVWHHQPLMDVSNIWPHSHALHTKWGKHGNEAKQHQYSVLGASVRWLWCKARIYKCSWLTHCMTGINFSHQDWYKVTSNTCTQGTYSPESPRSNIPFVQALEKLKLLLLFWLGTCTTCRWILISIACDNYATNSDIYIKLATGLHFVTVHEYIPLVDFVVCITVALIITGSTYHY